MGLIRHSDSGAICALDGEHIVGRSPRAALQLDSSYVSAQHASLRWHGDGWHLKDLGSKNGTFVGDVQVKPGQSHRLDRGSTITFGGATEKWELVDDNGPQAAVMSLSNEADGRLVQGSILALPSSELPLATVYSGAGGSWTLEGMDASSPLVNGQEFEAGGQRWRFFCPSSRAQAATTDWPELKGLSGARLIFRVSLDEEYVELHAARGSETIDLGSREHNYLLLFLARKHMEDAVSGVPPSSCGWVYQDEVLNALGVSAERLNVDVFRIRGQFVALVGRDGSAIVERRPKTKQLRIGTPLLVVQRI
jgi:hypothetical protein